ncbi:hypothetical protein, partial [Escherichia coli]
NSGYLTPSLSKMDFTGKKAMKQPTVPNALKLIRCKHTWFFRVPLVNTPRVGIALIAKTAFIQNPVKIVILWRKCQMSLHKGISP